MIYLRSVLGTFGELLQFFWEQKLWWLIPMLVILFGLAAIVILGTATGAGPFMYTLF